MVGGCPWFSEVSSVWRTMRRFPSTRARSLMWSRWVLAWRNATPGLRPRGGCEWVARHPGPVAAVGRWGGGVEERDPGPPAPEHGPVGRTDHLVAPAGRRLLRGVAEPEAAGVELLEPLGVVKDGGELLQRVRAVGRPHYPLVAREIPLVDLEVGGVDLLEPDQVRRVRLYGPDVYLGPAGPGVDAIPVGRAPDVEAHNPQGAAAFHDPSS